MNIIPKSFLATPSSIILSSTTSTGPGHVQHKSSNKQHQQTIVGEHRLLCVICADILDANSSDGIQMLAVRPSIGAPAGSPFFPVLETLTRSSASSVPCCDGCAHSMLQQWNEFENKNISIKNRHYNLKLRFNPSTTAVRQQQQQQSVVTSFSKEMIKREVSSSARVTGASQDGALDLSMPAQPIKPAHVLHRPRLTLKNKRNASHKLSTSNSSQFINAASSITNLLTLKSHSPSTNKKTCYSCSLCHDSCSQLLQISLKPVPNCPYFPTLAPYISGALVDINSRINVCESCHRQLIQQWDHFQKANQPVNERVYQVVNNNFLNKSKNPGTEPLILGATLTRNSLIQSATPATAQILAISTQPSSSPTTINPKELFQCEICHKDLLLAAASSTPNDSSAHIAISMLTEIDTSVVNTAATIMKKLILQSAQNINLLPFVTSSTPSAQIGQQIQVLIESGRVLSCLKCFESIATLPANSGKPSSANGKMSSMPDTNVDQPCVGCRFNKAQHFVETKENGNKAFFPLLADVSESNGRARVCAACHLMLETQWDAFEASYIPFSQRTYRLTNSSSSSNYSNKHVPSILKRPPSINSHNGSSMVISHSNGQSAPTPLKIQISSPSVITTTPTNVSSVPENSPLLLTTVTADSSNVQSNGISAPLLLPDNDRILHVINEFFAKLGDPSPMLSGKCSVCQEQTKKGETYHLCSSPQKFLLSPELGFYPYFPMLAKTSLSNRKRALTYKNMETLHLACSFCFHSLIAQWAAYQLSSYPEDHDPKTRVYNCRNFICYVCGVTTYRSRVRSINVKDFPFLIEHKRPPGALSLFKGNNVVTCLDCFNTLTHQWVENERMKVPLELRLYNWMPSPQPPPPPSAQQSQPVQQVHPGHLILTQPNGGGGPTVTLVPNKASAPTQYGGVEIVSRSTTQNSVVLHPSHTLAPLVAAAMAAQPVSLESSLQLNGNNPALNMVNSSFADALRHLARQQQPNSHTSPLSSNLSTLANVALSRTSRSAKPKAKPKPKSEEAKIISPPQPVKNRVRSIVDIIAERKQNRIAERRQQKIADSNRQHDELSVISGDDRELEDIEDDEDFDFDFDDVDDFDTKSVDEFIQDMAQEVQPEEPGDRDKEDFLFHFGLANNRKLNEVKLSKFVEDKLSRRVSHYSYKLEMFEEEEFLEADEDNHLVNSYLQPIDELPVFEENSEKVAFMKQLGLEPCREPVELLKREISWLEVQQDRRHRLEKGVVCFGKLYNNFSDMALARWLTKLTTTSSNAVGKNPSKISLTYIRSLLKIEESAILTLDVTDSNTSKQTESNIQDNISTNVTQTSVQNKKSNATTLTSQAAAAVLNLPTNKVINSQQFAQEFHQSVLLETEKQQANKPLLAMNNPKVEKREQLIKMQQRIVQIANEEQYLIAKKMEIESSLRKLDDERQSLQSEFERLSKLFDGDFNPLRV